MFLSSFFAPALEARTPAQLAVIAGVALIAGLARGFSGFGAALIFVPLAGAILTPRLSSPILLLIDNIGALGLIPRALPLAQGRDVLLMSAGALLGTPLGVWALATLPSLTTRWSITALALALLGLLASGWRFRNRPRAAFTLAVGAAAGLCSGAAQAGGPPVVWYWLGGAVAAATARANIVIYFALSSVLTTGSYFAAGLLSREALALALVCGPFYALGVFVGARLFAFASEAAFRRLSYALIAAAAVLSAPLWDGVLR